MLNFRGVKDLRKGDSMDYSGTGDRWAWDYITLRRQGLYLVYKRYILLKDRSMICVHIFSSTFL